MIHRTVIALAVAGILALAPLYGILALGGQPLPSGGWAVKVSHGSLATDSELAEYLLAREGRVRHLFGDWYRVWSPAKPAGELIEVAEPIPYYGVAAVVDDTWVELQNHLEQVTAPMGWGFTHGDGATIGVVDTGAQCWHPELEGKCDYVLYTGYSGDHATHVAGIAAANTNNGRGVAGVGYNAGIISCRTSNDGTRIDTAMAAECVEAISLAATGPLVLNASFEGSVESLVLTDAIARARARGVPLVAAAGNGDTNEPRYPCATTGVFCVGAVDGNDDKAGFSNWGASIDISAPGVGILSLLPNSMYGWLSGTSMSSPIVASAYALLLARFPEASLDELEAHLVATTDNLAMEGMGGRLNIGRAVQNMDSTSTKFVYPAQPITQTATATITATQEVTWTATVSSTATLSPTETVTGEPTGTPIAFPPTEKPAPTPSKSATATPVSASATPAPTETPTGTPTPTQVMATVPPCLPGTTEPGPGTPFPGCWPYGEPFTPTPTPSSTSRPTETSEPTSTLEPTPTPVPTWTPVPWQTVEALETQTCAEAIGCGPGKTLHFPLLLTRKPRPARVSALPVQ